MIPVIDVPFRWRRITREEWGECWRMDRFRDGQWVETPYWSMRKEMPTKDAGAAIHRAMIVSIPKNASKA